ncbi:hypothetical protein EBT31_00810 [bacterium]|nr:hypothetical protein [bacterium]
MPNPDNEPQLPKNQSPITDDRTGLVSRDWYRFFLNLLNKANQGGGGGTGTVTSVNVSGGTTGLTTSGGPVTTSGTITLAGTLDVDNGGTGATTASGARTNLGAAASGANSDITSMSGITGPISSPTYIQMGNGSGTTLAAGRMWYDQTTGSWNMGMGGGAVTQQVGEELYVYGKATAAISDSPLQIVYHTGTVGSSGVVTFAPTIAGITDINAIVGVATENIALNGFGRITNFGVVRNITTNGAAYGETWADDDIIWYNPVTGNPTNVEPTAPNIKIQVGIIITAGPGGSGSFQVLLRPGSVLGGTDSNVQFSTLANNNLIQYDSALQYWKNVTPGSVTGVGSVANALTAGTGISYSVGTTYNGSVAVTINNSAPDQTVVLTGGTGISTSGTYPNFTITNTAPDQVVSLTGAGTTSISGTYPNFTITSNDQYVGTVTSVSGTGTVNGISLSGTVTSSGSLTLGGTLSNVSLTTQVTGTLPIANGGTGQTTASAAFNALSPVTSTGDLIIGNGANSSTRLPIGANTYVLTSNGTTATWALPTGSGATITNDTSTSTNVYPTFAAATSGSLSTIYTSNAKYLYKPSTGELTSEHFVAGNGIFVNSLTIDTSYTIAAGTSGMSAGPITVASGTTVTVASGSRWVVV